MYSRIVVAPSGKRTMSRRTSSNAPSNTRAPSTRVSSKCRSDETTLRPGRGSTAIEPVPRDEEIAVELRLAGFRRRLPVIAPFNAEWRRHQARLGSSAGLQPYEGPAIPEGLD